MSGPDSLFDLKADELAALARRAADAAVRRTRAAGVTPAGVVSTGRGKRTAFAEQAAAARRAKAAVRGT